MTGAPRGSGVPSWMRRVGGTACGTTTFCFDGSSVVLEKQGATTSAAYTYGEALLTRGGEVVHTDGHGDLRTVTDGGQNVTATGNYEPTALCRAGPAHRVRRTSTGRRAATGTTGTPG